MEGGEGLHHTMVALKLQQFQYNLNNNFFGAFGAEYFCQSDGRPEGLGGLQGGALQGG